MTAAKFSSIPTPLPDGFGGVLEVPQNPSRTATLAP